MKNSQKSKIEAKFDNMHKNTKCGNRYEMVNQTSECSEHAQND